MLFHNIMYKVKCFVCGNIFAGVAIKEQLIFVMGVINWVFCIHTFVLEVQANRAKSSKLMTNNITAVYTFLTEVEMRFVGFSGHQ